MEYEFVTAFNFRELGGIPLANGRRVKHGMLFRSSKWDGAGDDEIEEFKKIGIKTVVDFRETDERKANGLYEAMNVDCIRLPFSIFRGIEGTMQIEKTMPRVYARQVLKNKSCRKFFEILKADSAPLMFHCTAGKDRTGIAAALILLLLGASDDEIVKDYMKTAVHTDKLIVKWTTEGKHAKLVKIFVKRAMPTIVTREPYIQGALKRIRKKYPSTEEYFLKEYGLTEKDIADLKDKFTEPIV